MGAAEPEILPVEPEGSESSGERLVANGATLMRVEHDAMLAVSVQRPRKEKLVLERALAELDMVPALAERNFYAIPYEDRREGKTVIVTGPSIHAARSLARRWGNCGSKAVITGEDEDKVYLAGIFVDLETNVRFERPLTVSKWLRKRNGDRYRLNDQRLVQAIQAGASKAERNAILAGLPDYLVQSYDLRAREIAAKDAKAGWSKLMEAFKPYGVTREALERHLGHPLEKVTDEEIVDLRGIYNAIKDGQTSASDVFPPAKAEDAEKDAATVDDVLKGGATVKEKPEPDDTDEPEQPGLPT